jgi:hypothetical protein
MIASSEGKVTCDSVVNSQVTMLVSTTGTAYTKTGKVNAVIRFFKKIYRKIKYTCIYVSEFVVVFCSKTGKPQSIEPPAMARQNSFYI